MTGASFHATGTAPTADSWLGLFRKPIGGYDLREAVVRIDTIPRACAPATIVTTDALPYIFLVAGVPGLRPGPIDTAFRGYTFLEPGQQLLIRFGARQYRLAARGAAHVVPYTTVYSPYALGMSAVGSQDSAVQVLDSLTFSADNTPDVLWAGDIDRDGRLDLFLQLPGGGYSRVFKLFLSSLARPGELVAEAGSFYWHDC
jgi:hypothetical protein